VKDEMGKVKGEMWEKSIPNYSLFTFYLSPFPVSRKGPQLHTLCFVSTATSTYE